MALFGDYHTHSVYSRRKHGKGTIEENVQSAVKKGLRQIAITDHGVVQAFPEAMGAAKGNNIKYLRGWINRVFDE